MQAEHGAARSVHVVDDEAMVRRSLTLLLQAAGIEARSYGSGEDFLRAAENGLPFGCVLLDIRMPGMDGLAVLRAMAARGLQLPVVVVTAHGDVPLAVEAMKAGACDFIEKPYAGATILRAVEAALGRGDEALERAREATEAAARLATLTPRETEVLQGLVAGRQNKVIALDLGLSPRTVEIHRANVMAKLRAGSLSEAVRIALAAGLPPAPPAARRGG
ncbi:response regulator transcription factor [Roseicella aerolata]|uniref:Response regulator n=1 Tax=Roseicella aerolata TaxID=2883479 RepID=A0A9X1LBU7_9PROT|nr:response regulator [Roseicella aerolata]MCB4823570.1 response regulator [Roseicella aerolata]